MSYRQILTAITGCGSPRNCLILHSLMQVTQAEIADDARNFSEGHCPEGRPTSRPLRERADENSAIVQSLFLKSQRRLRSPRPHFKYRSERNRSALHPRDTYHDFAKMSGQAYPDNTIQARIQVRARERREPGATNQQASPTHAFSTPHAKDVSPLQLLGYPSV